MKYLLLPLLCLTVNCYSQNSVSFGVLDQLNLGKSGITDGNLNYQLVYLYNSKNYFKPTIILSKSKLTLVENFHTLADESKVSFKSETFNLLIGNTSQIMKKCNVLVAIGLQYRYGNSLIASKGKLSLDNVSIELNKEKSILPIISFGLDYNVFQLTERFGMSILSSLQFSPLDKSQQVKVHFTENGNIWQFDNHTISNSILFLIGAGFTYKLN